MADVVESAAMAMPSVAAEDHPPESVAQAEAVPAKRRRTGSAKWKAVGLARVQSFIISNISRDFDAGLLQSIQQQADLYGILPDLRSVNVTCWSDLVDLVNQEKDIIEPFAEATPDNKRPKKAAASAPTQATATPKPSKKPLHVKPLKQPAASTPAAPAGKEEDELTRAAAERTLQSRGLRKIVHIISESLEQGDDLSLHSSVNRQKVVEMAEQHRVLEDVPLRNADVDWLALKSKAEAMLEALERQRKQLTVARRKQREAEVAAPAKQAPPLAAKAAKKPRPRKPEPTLEAAGSEEPTDAPARKRPKKAALPPASTARPAVQESALPHVRKMLEMMDQFEDRATAVVELRSYAHQAGVLESLFEAADLPQDEGWEVLRQRLTAVLNPPSGSDGPKVGRKKQCPVVSAPSLVPGRQKQRPEAQNDLSAVKPALGCPVLELDEGTKAKLDTLRQMRAIAWEDAHLTEGFSADRLEGIRRLEEQHALLGPPGAAAFAAYMREGPKELLGVLKATLDRLEGAKRKKKKRDAFEVMRTASKALAKEKPTPKKKASGILPAVTPLAGDADLALELQQLKEAAAAERQRKAEAERLEKERRAEELQQQKEEAKRKREEEKELRRLQKELEKEEERRRREAEREEEKTRREAEREEERRRKEQKKEEDRRKKEEEKKGPPPKVLDKDLAHRTPLPAPCYRLDVDPALFSDIMLGYNFLYIFGDALRLTRFPFQLWVKALTAFNENKIVEEAFRQLVAVCEEERPVKQSRRGGNWMGDVTALLADTIGLSRESRNRNARGGKKEESDSESSDDANDDCMVCKKRNPLKQLLTCQLCDRFYHMRCVDPPVEDFVEAWKCPECVAEAAEAGEGEAEGKEPPAAETEAQPDADTVQLTALCERAQELGRHNTYQNWGISERIQWLKHLVRLALETETISELVRDNTSQVATLWRDYAAQKKELQAEEAAAIRELMGKKETEGEEEEDADDDEKAEKVDEVDEGEGEKDKGKKAPKDKEKERKDKEERKKRRQEVQALKERTQAKLDELLLKHREAVEKLQCRVFPLGEDRHRRLYWRFPGDPNLWVQEVKGYTEAVPVPPAPLDAGAAAADDDDEGTTPDRSWGYFSAVDTVLEALDDRGIRESKLKAALEQLKWSDDRSPDRLLLPRHFQLKYYFNRYKSSAHQKNPLEWA
eukprot:EG_transcript_871